MIQRQLVASLLDDLRDRVWRSEAEVARRLIDPCLALLGWDDDSLRREVWLPLTDEMAGFWNYSSGRMRRDYVLLAKTAHVAHIEAKHRWGRRSFNLATFLDQVNSGDWHDTSRDGPKKDLALLLWGANSQGAERTVIWDESQLLVFDWHGGWTVREEEKHFQTPLDQLCGALELLEPTAFGGDVGRS